MNLDRHGLSIFTRVQNNSVNEGAQYSGCLSCDGWFCGKTLLKPFNLSSEECSEIWKPRGFNEGWPEGLSHMRAVI
ncbi:MAG: hypothetical protein ACRECI_00845 [Methyloceanibacter sp.]